MQNPLLQVASVGIAVGDWDWGCELGGIDQSSYMGEVWALYWLMLAIQGIQGDVWVIISIGLPSKPLMAIIDSSTEWL